MTTLIYAQNLLTESDELNFDWHDFDMLTTDYWYKENNPDDEDADSINEIHARVYAKVAEKCNEEGKYGIFEVDGHFIVCTPEEYNQKLYDLMSDEEKAQKDEENLQQAIVDKRAERNNILETVVDPIVTNPLRWNELSTDQQQAYTQYRLYLLDIPQQESFPYIEILSLDDFMLNLNN